MTAPTSSNLGPSKSAAAPGPSSEWNDDDSEARDLAQFIAGQNPRDAEAVAWLVSRQDGLSSRDEAKFQDWLAADPAHGEALNRLGGFWDRLGELPSANIDVLKAGLPTGQAAHVTSSATAAKPAADSQDMHAGRRGWVLGWGSLMPQAAFAGLVAIAAVGGWTGWEHWQHRATYTQTFATARGEQTEVSLPDGSRMRLDTATRAEVKLYRQRREVRLLEGQALFTVQPHVAKPFDVLAGPLRITVIGTRFSVRHTASGLAEGGASVEVEEGQVRVAHISGALSSKGYADAGTVELTASQAITADSHGRLGVVKLLAIGAGTAWREGRVVLDDTPLGQALAEFERYADTGLVLSDPDVAALRLNGSFDPRQFNAFKRALPQVLPVRLQLRSDGKTEIVQTR
jgi:transmembrane sensor